MVKLTIYARPKLKPNPATPLDLFLDQCLNLDDTIKESPSVETFKQCVQAAPKLYLNHSTKIQLYYM